MRAVDSFTPHTARSAAALKAAGVVCALRYHYNLTPSEVRDLHAAGVAVCLIAEFDTQTVHPVRDTPQAGTDHGNRAVAVARSLGFPPGALIYFTADTMVYPAQFSTAAQYFALAAAVVRAAGYRVGAYGGSLLIDDLMRRGLADVTWEAAARSWSSPDGSTRNYQPSKTASLRQTLEQPQIGGVTVDMNDYLAPHAGEWLPDGSVSQGPTPEEDDMPAPVKYICILNKANDYLGPGVYSMWSHSDRIVPLSGEERDDAIRFGDALAAAFPGQPRAIQVLTDPDQAVFVGSTLEPRHPTVDGERVYVDLQPMLDAIKAIPAQGAGLDPALVKTMIGDAISTAFADLFARLAAASNEGR